VIVRYRVVEDWLDDEGVWFPWGVFYENRGSDLAEYTLLIRAIPDDDRRKGRYFDRRIRELRPSIEEAEVVLGEYADRYRVLPEVRTVEGENYREIRDRLWEVIFEEMDKRRAERRVEYAAPEPTYTPLREGAEEPEEED